MHGGVTKNRSSDFFTHTQSNAHTTVPIATFDDAFLSSQMRAICVTVRFRAVFFCSCYACVFLHSVCVCVYFPLLFFSSYIQQGKGFLARKGKSRAAGARAPTLIFGDLIFLSPFRLNFTTNPSPTHSIILKGFDLHSRVCVCVCVFVLLFFFAPMSVDKVENRILHGLIDLFDRTWPVDR